MGTKRTAFASIALFGLGFLAVVGLGGGGWGSRKTNWPPAVREIIYRHVSADDLQAWFDAWNKHVAAGRPQSYAALMTMANIHLGPDNLEKIKADLDAAGWDAAAFQKFAAALAAKGQILDRP